MLTLIYRPEEGMICLSRSEENPVEIDIKSKVRTNFNELNITNGFLYCGNEVRYKLENLCKHCGPTCVFNHPCILKTGEEIQLHPK